MNNYIHPPAASASAAQLAYLGDAVLELFVRRSLVLLGEPHPSEAALSYVTAPAQSDALERIQPMLSEEEALVYRRARNTVHANVPKRATVAQYRRATGLEALFGYLELQGDNTRMQQLFFAAYPELTPKDAARSADCRQDGAHSLHTEET